MTRSIRTPLLAGAAVALVGTLVAAPAMAQTVVTHDAAHDVLVQDAQASGHPTQRAPHHRDGDARSLRVTYGPHRVQLTLRFSRLAEPRGAAVQLLAVATDTGRRAELELFTTRAGGAVHRTWSVNDHEQKCPGLRTSISHRSATVRMTVPRSCLGNPTWVRAGGGSGTLLHDRVYADDVTLDGRVRNELALGKRVHRG